MVKTIVRPAGPIDVAVLGFVGTVPTRAVLDSCAEALRIGAVHILDALIVERSVSGDLTVIDIATSADAVAVLGHDVSFPGLLGAEDAQLVAHELPPGSSALLIAWENTWAARVAAAVVDLGGRVFAHERIPAHDVDAVVGALA